MGRKNKKYHKDLIQQIHDNLHEKMCNGIGRSKKADKATGEDTCRIYSYATYHNYYKHCKYFARYIRDVHPECTTLRAAARYVIAWLKMRATQEADNKLSAWTICLEVQALKKLYQGVRGVNIDWSKFESPKRRRQDIVRSRVPAVRDSHFSATNNAEFISFCRATGCRRNVIEKLRGADLYSLEEMIALCDELRYKARDEPEEQQYIALCVAIAEFGGGRFTFFVRHRTDKNGKERYAPILSSGSGSVVSRMQNTPAGEKVWWHVPSNADIHSYRAEYAAAVYKIYATEIMDYYAQRGEQIPRAELYYGRKDTRGRVLIRQAMYKCSLALGHSRIDVIANNYLRGL